MSDQGSPVPPQQKEPPAIEHHILEGFTEAVSRLVLSVEAFGENVQNAELRRERAALRLRRLLIIGIVVLSLLAGTAAFGVVRLNVFSSTNRQNIKINQTNSDIIRDCVVPGGVCFARNQANLAAAVRQANDADNNGKIDANEILQKLDELQRTQDLQRR